MKKLLIFLMLCTMSQGQTGPHRKVFTPSINCTNFASSGIIESETNGNIFWDGGVLAVTLTSSFVAGDIVEVVAANDSTNATSTPTISGGGLTWIPLELLLEGTGSSRGVWYAVATSSFTGLIATVDYHTTSSFSVQYSVSAVHISHTFIPSFVGPTGNTGTYPTSPNYTMNASTVTFGSGGTGGDTWLIGGVGIPSTATYMHGLIIVGVTGGATYSGSPPAGWHSIIVAGFPSSGLFYACSFP